MSLTAPITVISDVQRSDIAASKGPTDVMDGMYRAKQYVKDDEKRLLSHPRTMAFDQPWQWAASKAEYTDDVFGIDRVFLGQLAACNLRCDECYAGGDCKLNTVQVAPEEYVDAFDAYCEGIDWCSTLRISGGEPMLFQAWVAETLREADRLKGQWKIRWIDTNLTIPVDTELLAAISDRNKDTAINGCLKPNRKFINGTDVDIDDQLQVVEQIVLDFCNLFLYWPAWDKEPNTDLFEHTLCELKSIDYYLPLRLTVTETKKYEASPNMDSVTAEELKEFFRTRREAHHEFLFENYHPDLIHMPSHLTLGMV
jgi:uncharacterized Fe-S cluster-containing radical SAM superfamily protein